MKTKLIALILALLVLNSYFAFAVDCTYKNQNGENTKITIDITTANSAAVNDFVKNSPQAVDCIRNMNPTEAMILFTANPSMAESYFKTVGTLSNPKDRELAQTYLFGRYGIPVSIQGNVAINGNQITSNGRTYSLDQIKTIKPAQVISPPASSGKGLIFVMCTTNSNKCDQKTGVTLELSGEGSISSDGKGGFIFNGQRFDFGNSKGQDITVDTTTNKGYVTITCNGQCNFKRNGMDISMGFPGTYMESGRYVKVTNTRVSGPNNLKIEGDAVFWLTETNGQFDPKQRIELNSPYSKGCYNNKCAMVPPLERGQTQLPKPLAVCFDQCSKEAVPAVSSACNSNVINERRICYLDNDITSGKYSGYVFWDKTMSRTEVDRATARGKFIANFNHDFVMGQNRDIKFTFISDYVTQPDKTKKTINDIKFEYVGTGTNQGRVGTVMTGKSAIFLNQEGDKIYAQEYLPVVPKVSLGTSTMNMREASAFYVDAILNPYNVDFDSSTPTIVDNIDPLVLLKVAGPHMNPAYFGGMPPRNEGLMPDLFDYYFKTAQRQHPELKVAYTDTSGLGFSPTQCNDIACVYQSIYKDKKYENWLFKKYNVDMPSESTLLHNPSYVYDPKTREKIPVENVYASEGKTLVLGQKQVLQSGIFGAYLNVEYRRGSYVAYDSLTPTQKAEWTKKGITRDSFAEQRVNQMQTKIYLESQQKDVANLLTYIVDESHWALVKAAKEYAFESRESAMQRLRDLRTQETAVDKVQTDRDRGVNLMDIRRNAISRGDTAVQDLFQEPSMNFQFNTEVITNGKGPTIINGKSFDLSDPNQRKEARYYSLTYAAEQYANPKVYGINNVPPDYDRAMEYYTAIASLTSSPANFNILITQLPNSGITLRSESQYSPVIANSVDINGQKYIIPPELYKKMQSGELDPAIVLRMISLQQAQRDDASLALLKEMGIGLIPNSAVELALNVLPEIGTVGKLGILAKASLIQLLEKGTFLAGVKGLGIVGIKSASVGLIGVGFERGGANAALREGGELAEREALDGALMDAKIAGVTMDEATRASLMARETPTFVRPIEGNSKSYYEYMTKVYRGNEELFKEVIEPLYQQCLKGDCTEFYARGNRMAMMDEVTGGRYADFASGAVGGQRGLFDNSQYFVGEGSEGVVFRVPPEIAQKYGISAESDLVVKISREPQSSGGMFLTFDEQKVIMNELNAKGFAPRAVASGPDYLVVEYVPGETLEAERAAAIRAGDNSAVASIDAQKTEFKKTLCEKGFDIWDLHAENIMVKPNGQMVLIDAGGVTRFNPADAGRMRVCMTG